MQISKLVNELMTFIRGDVETLATLVRGDVETLTSFARQDGKNRLNAFTS